ncbi:transcriptional regulator [Desulfotruncus alcoholivorax]|uniref:PAS domain-containing protein n=1 Tax=Desulfotruncus alcoholivorax TaxID=265477 RepID=UPI0003FB8987|nr:PAS domain-containing protein [Desulfotruncus alcoholivorax]
MKSKKKILVYFAIIFFLTLIILFFVLEFRYINRVVSENRDNIRQIVLSEVYSYMRDLQLLTEDAANFVEDENGPAIQSLRSVAGRDERITGVYLLDQTGKIISSFKGNEPGVHRGALAGSAQGIPYIFGVEKNGRLDQVGVAAVVSGQAGKLFLVLTYNVNDFVNQFILKYNTSQVKAGIMNQEGLPLVWPFDQAALANFSTGVETLKFQNERYAVSRADLENSSLDVYFFDRQSNFDAYRIITIMFLLFMLYFLIYQFIVELLNANNIQSYFENIDFNIFNHLKEGIIIANKFNRVVFANNVIHEIFAEKEIVLKKTSLKEITGPLDSFESRLTLKKANNLLEIISAPIVKNGKLLGALVVVSLSHEKEKLCGRALDKIIELSPDGVVFVDKDGKVVTCNMMASYYLGNVKPDLNIDHVSTELAGLIENSIGSGSVTRENLSFGDIYCELAPLYDAGGFYAGTVVFLKDSSKSG